MSTQRQGSEIQWQDVLDQLRKTLSPDTVLRWFSAVELDSIEEGKALLSVPNNIYQFWIEANHGRPLLDALQAVDPNIREFVIAVRLDSRAKKRTKQATYRQGRKVFISYSHRDSQLVERLLVHLRPLDRDLKIETWTDRSIRPGTDWRGELQKAIANADTVILLVSADFLASEFIMTEELPSLLKQRETKGATILPLICTPCRYMRTPELARFQALNDPSEPLLKMAEVDREAVFNRVAEVVEDSYKK
jgi:TIR domain/DnaA N-terminal domain